MSLTDALLLDPQKLDVWIALRTDGVRGSGTESDPYDGSVRTQPFIPLISLARDANPTVAVASTGGSAHGYVEGDVATITGVTGAEAAYYNGTFNVFTVTANTFKYQMSQDPGASASGTNKTSQLDSRLFDAWMRRIGQYSAVNLSPGVFETRGNGNSPAGWQPQSHQRIAGSGIGVTTLKLVEAAAQDGSYSAVLVPWPYYVTDCEICDLTVDCNLGGQPIPIGKDFAPVTCGAVSIRGSHVRIRRVRAINFGCQGAQEPFVISTAWAHPQVLAEPVDSIIEECIAEQPSINNTHETTVLHLGAAETPSEGIMGFHRACEIRNCVVDCEYRINPVAIQSIAYTGTKATVTTRQPHGRLANDGVRIAGAVMNGAADNPYNGSFEILGGADAPTSTTFKYTMAATPTAAPLGEMWVDRFSSHYVAINNIHVDPATPALGQWTVTVTTATPHFRVRGNNVLVGVVMPTSFNGSFKITNVPSPTQLQFVLSSDPGTATAYGLIGASFQALSAGGGTAAIIAGNRVLNCRIGGPYHDTFTGKDEIIRNNYYRAVVTGPYENLGGPLSISGAGVPILLTSLNHTGNTALAVTNTAHALNNTESVTIAGATGPDASYYNGSFAITVTGATTFQYTMPMGTPGGPALGYPGYFVYVELNRQTNTYHPLKSLTFALENGVYVATVESYYQEHGLAVGDAVIMSRASVSQYNGYFPIIEVIASVLGISNAKFKYLLPSNPTANSTTGYFGRLWQVGRMVIENNVIELVPTPTNWGSPLAIALGYGSFASPPLFRQMVIRGNIIRHVDGASDPPGMLQGIGIQVSGCGELIVEDNVVDLDTTTPIEYYHCDTVRFFNNRTSAGALLQGYEVLLFQKADELTTQIEDACVLSL